VKFRPSMNVSIVRSLFICHNNHSILRLSIAVDKKGGFTMKRSLTLLTALGLTASMICTGCGNGNTTETASSSSSKSDVKAESTPEATPEPTEEAVSTVSEPVEETKKERDGFKDGTVEYELDGLTFSIPTYFGDASSTNENGSSWSNDENTVLLAIYQLVDQIINNGYIKLPLFLLRKSRPIDISNDKQQAHDLLLQNTNRFSGQVLLSISPVFPAASVLSFC